MKLALLSLLGLLAASASLGADDASSVIEKTAAAYLAMESYAVDGTMVCDLHGRPFTESAFTIRLARPELFEVTTYEAVSPEDRSRSRRTVDVVAWNPGDGPYCYLAHPRLYAKESLDDALGCVNQRSFVPRLFFRGWTGALPDPSAAALLGTERVGKEQCFVLAWPDGKKVWISTKHFVIVQTYKRFEPDRTPRTETPAPPRAEMTEAQKNYARAREIAHEAVVLMGNGTMECTATYRAMGTKPKREAIRFTPPPGTTFTDDLFRALFDPTADPGAR